MPNVRSITTLNAARAVIGPRRASKRFDAAIVRQHATVSLFAVDANWTFARARFLLELDVHMGHAIKRRMQVLMLDTSAEVQWSRTHY